MPPARRRRPRAPRRPGGGPEGRGSSTSDDEGATWPKTSARTLARVSALHTRAAKNAKMAPVSEDRGNTTGNIILIDEEGRLTADPGAERRLAAYAGRYRVLPTAGEIVLLQRADAPSRQESSNSAL